MEKKKTRLKQWVWYALIIIPELVLIMQLITIGDKLNEIIEKQNHSVEIIDIRLFNDNKPEC